MEIRTYPDGPLQANLYIIAFESDAIIIDPCVPYQSLGLKNSKVRGIICTHSHYDHIVEAENIRTLTKSMIYAYEDEKEAIMDADMNGSSLFFEAVSISPPIIGLNNGDVLTARDFQIDTKDDFSLTVIHTPGHTYGSMCLLLKVKTESLDKEYLFSGDTVFAGSIGRTDLGGSMPDMKRSIKLLSQLPDNVIVLPGHGQSTTMGNEKNNNPYFTSINDDDII
jgi:hydroxyacylglutathione hydrolase